MESPTVIGEVKCSKIMYDELTQMGAKAVMYKTGHSNLKVKMRELNADLACEVSGHIFFKHRYFGFDDAIYATLRVLELIKDGIDIDMELDSLPKAIFQPEGDFKFKTNLITLKFSGFIEEDKRRITYKEALQEGLLLAQKGFKEELITSPGLDWRPLGIWTFPQGLGLGGS